MGSTRKLITKNALHVTRYALRVTFYKNMDINKFTTNSQQALKAAQAIAFEKKHSQIDTLHILAALLAQKDSIVVTILNKLEIPIQEVTQYIEQMFKKLPKGHISSQAGQVFITPEMNYLLVQAEREASKFGDEFISTEHLLLALIVVDSLAA